MKLEIFDYHKIFPFKEFGLTGSFWTVHIDTLLFTWLSMAVIGAGILFMRSQMKKKESLFVVAGEYLIELFVNLYQESAGWFNRKACGFTVALFLFTLICNVIALLPYIEEPTRDLNTTLALALCSFFYVQIQGVASHGLSHFKEFIEPIWFLLPLNLVSEAAKVLSMSFRLFGNILAGSIIILLITKLKIIVNLLIVIIPAYAHSKICQGKFFKMQIHLL